MSTNVLTYERPLPGELGTDWETTWEMKNILRESLNLAKAGKRERNNAVLSDRATGKSTALIQFVAERHLVLHPKNRVGVLVPTINIGKLLERHFKEQFPTVRPPLIIVVEDNPFAVQEKVSGSGVVELYAEEMFMMEPRLLELLGNLFIAGVGTLKRPVGVRIQEW